MILTISITAVITTFAWFVIWILVKTIKNKNRKVKHFVEDEKALVIMRKIDDHLKLDNVEVNLEHSKKIFWFKRKSKLYIYSFTEDKINIVQELELNKDVYNLITGQHFSWYSYSDKW